MTVATLPTAGLVDELLLDVARQIQLPPSDYRLANQHYGAISRYVEREGSPLRGLVMSIYGQGSVSIGSVVSSKFDSDEFDVDAIVQLAISPGAPPARVLETLYEALDGEPGSLYHGKVRRNTRCVSIDYSGMHFDLTPAVLLPGEVPRISHIFHARESEPQHMHRHVVANPWGFANWFTNQMPSAYYFAERILSKAAEPLPDQSELEQKSLPLIALQLTKRWRNLCYEKRANMRRPPSVLLSYFFAMLGGQRRSLLEELVVQAQNLLQIIDSHNARETLISVRNPTCREDVFSDRWPASMTDQRRFGADLKALVSDLATLSASPSLEDCSRIMTVLFGERPVRKAVTNFSERYSASAHSNSLRQYLGSGAIALGASNIGQIARPSASSVLAPRNTYFGSDEDGDRT